MEFVGWKEDWEKKLKKKNCTVVEAQFFTKYKPVFFCLQIMTKCMIFSKELWSFTVRRLVIELESVMKMALKIKVFVNIFLLH